MTLPSILKEISQALSKQNAKAIVVGGSVRDWFLGLPAKDYDIEVYGLDCLDQLQSLLLQYGSVNLVGRSFGVLKFTYGGEEYDFSFPRKETKVDLGHRGFDVLVNGTMSFEDASRRRDFSCNAMGYMIDTGELLDPFDGRVAMKARLLKHIDRDTFTEDPLRVYRAVQFAARFDYKIDVDTLKLCKRMVSEGMLDELPKERIYEEFKKLLLKSNKPSVGFELMRELGITSKYFPELHALINTPQSPKWHPEGDVWVHTMMAVDAMAILSSVNCDDQKQKFKFLLAILCHDLGKPDTTTVEDDGRIRAIGHERAGIEPTKNFLYRLTNEHSLIDSILPLVEHHLKPSQYYKNGAKDKTIRKLAISVNIKELILVAKADFLGRTSEDSLAGVYSAGKWLLDKASTLGVEEKPLKTLLKGRDLVDMGLNPSPKFTQILDEVYSRQISGEIMTKEQATKYIQHKVFTNDKGRLDDE